MSVALAGSRAMLAAMGLRSTTFVSVTVGVVLLGGACGDPDDPDALTTIDGALVEVGTGAPVTGRISGFPDLGTVATSSPAGTFALPGARFGVRYRLVAEAQGYIDSEINVVPRFGQPTTVEIALQPAIACTAGQRRCARGGQQGVETCTADGRGFTLEACAPGDICDPARAECVSAPSLRVMVTGNGSVVSNPSGILCNPTCERSFPVGTELVLEARPFGDGAFDGWGGACSGADLTCSLRLDSDLVVQADFRTTAYRLTVETRGGGDVQSTPPGIDCGDRCQALFDVDTDVTLVAQPDAGREFVQWEDDCSGASPTCVVRMSRSREALARFRRPGPVLTVTKQGPGSGRVVSEPDGIDCGVECSSGFDSGSNVRLTATADTGSRFAGWGGACTGMEPTCTVTMSQARSVTARFEGDTVQITVGLVGGALGTVRSVPAGIDCGSTCAAAFARGTSVSLSATPDAGAVFAGWTGDCASAGLSASCELVPAADATVEARFEPFYLAPLPADAACFYGLDFELPDRLDPSCGSTATASAADWTPSPSRSALLGDALSSPNPIRPLDLGEPGPGAAPATVELSVRSGGAGTLFADVDLADATPSGWRIRALQDGRLVASTFDGNGGTSTATTASGTLPTSGWAHVAVVAQTGSLVVFVDGAEAARSTGTLRLAASSSTAWVGSVRTGTVSSDGWSGTVDALRMSTSARYP